MKIRRRHINYFFSKNSRNLNDEYNKIREEIIISIINNKIPKRYFLNSKWKTLKSKLDSWIKKLIKNKKYDSIKAIKKAGRKFNYDFDIELTRNNSKTIYNVEFKFNAQSIDKVPQFVSPMKPSKYIISEFEKDFPSYFYDEYLPKIYSECNKFITNKITLPDKKKYCKQVHGNKPLCLKTIQEEYYKGIKKSSQFSGKSCNIKFSNYCKKLSKEAIKNYIEKSKLDTLKLENYLLKTQEKKVYLLFFNGEFILDRFNINDYKINQDTKKLSNRYECECRNGTKISVLLRWKNGNGIAFPAFQIKKIKKRIKGPNCKYLKKLCKDNSIKGFSKLKKKELIELLKSHNISINR